jgi:transcription initiation factor IIE alpha subunit
MEDKMTNEQIKDETEKMIEQIQTAQARLDEIQSTCKHEKAYIGKYSWRIGCIQDAFLCSYCGKFLKYVDTSEMWDIRSVSFTGNIEKI